MLQITQFPPLPIQPQAFCLRLGIVADLVNTDIINLSLSIKWSCLLAYQEEVFWEAIAEDSKDMTEHRLDVIPQLLVAAMIESNETVRVKLIEKFRGTFLENYAVPVLLPSTLRPIADQAIDRYMMRTQMKN